MIFLLGIISVVWFLVGVVVGFIMATVVVEKIIIKLKNENEILLQKTKK